MQVGDQIGHYTIVEHIGRGGMADVWSARDERLRRTVAVKTIAANLTEDRARQNFEHEARTVATLEHPNILPIYDFGEFERQLYIVMRYIPGGSLLDRLIEGPLPIPEVVRVGSAIAQALERAHAEKIVHRDLKPGNVLLDQFQIPYLADFGLAAVAGATEEGMSAGTLIYMPPEQMFGSPVDHRADIYAFAIMIFQMVTGEFPYEGKGALCLRQMQANEEIPDPSYYRPELSPHLHFVLRIATSKQAEARYDSAGLMMSKVTEALQEQPSLAANAELLAGAPPIEPIPYNARTEAAVDEDLIQTMAVGKEEDFHATMRIDSNKIVERWAARAGRDLDLPGEQVPGTPPEVEEPEVVPEIESESASLREAKMLFQRMVRAWAHGQGRFLTGATHFANIHAYYSQPEQHNLQLSDDGREVMLRGAIEHHYELTFWLSQSPDPDVTRKVCIHALRSALASARALAVRLLQGLPDTDPPSVAVLVGRLLHSETHPEARRAIVELLDHWAGSPGEWRSYAYSVDTDLLLAEQTLRDDAPDVAELAARAVGRLRSITAVEHVAEQRERHPALVEAALIRIRDEADSLPPGIPFRQRARSFRQLTGRYLSSDVGELGLRFFTSLLGTAIGMGVYVNAVFRTTSSILALRHLYRVIGLGQTFGLVAGFAVMLAAMLPLRLAGSAAKRENGATLWHWWARLLVGLIFGGLVGTIAYVNFQVVALQYQFADLRMEVLLLGGVGLALGAAAASTFRWPILARVGVAFATIYASLMLAWQLFTDGVTDAILYVDRDNQLWTFALLAILTAYGAYGPEVIATIRRVFRRDKKT